MPETIRLYTDENINPSVTVALVERGYDAISCHSAGNANQSLSDEWQLEWATSQDRAILSYNVRDFSPIATNWSLTGRTHSGILLIREIPIGELIRRTSAFLDSYSADDLRNATMWVS